MAGKRNNNANHAKKRHVKKEAFTWKSLTEKQQKLVKVGSIIAAIIIIALIALNSFDLLPHFDGHLHLVNGNLWGAGENDLIVNTQERHDPRYFNVGSVEIPEGYYNDEEFHSVISTSEYADYSQKYCYRPEDKSSPIRMVSVQGTAAGIDHLVGLLEEMYSDPEANILSEKIDRVSKVKGNHYYGYHSTSVEPVFDRDSDGNITDAYYSTNSVGYIDIGAKNRSIMVYVSLRSDSMEEVPSEEELGEILDQMIDTVTVK
ncbi:MAG: hypothetical protein IJC48_09875 [Clostridia bacterium]|nr:hypothetical protein [Clostridia bacterium]